jgi:hypothetical protein
VEPALQKQASDINWRSPPSNAVFRLSIEQSFAAQSGAMIMAERGGGFVIVAVAKQTSTQRAGDPPPIRDVTTKTFLAHFGSDTLRDGPTWRRSRTPPYDRLARDRKAVEEMLAMVRAKGYVTLAHTIDTEVLPEDAPHLDLQGFIPLRPGRQPGGIALPGDMVVVGRRGDRQHLSDRLDPDHGSNRRSSSAWAKYADYLAQDLVGLPELPVLPLQGLQLLGDLGGKAGADAAVHLRLLHPLIERLSRAADLGRDRGNRRRSRRRF